ALHHSGKPLKDANGNYVGHDGQPITDHKPQENEIQWVANEGARTSRIVANILSRAAQGEAAEVLAASFKGDIQPKAEGLESAPVIGFQPMAGAAIRLPDMRPATAPDGGFAILLPLNVSVKVESLMQPPSAPREKAQPVAPAAGPAIIQPVASGEIVFEKLNFDTDYSDRAGYDEDFLGREREASMPEIDPGSSDQIAPTKKRGKVLHYHHYSAMVH